MAQSRKRKPRWKVVEQFADDMQRQLNANSHKGGADGTGWRGDNPVSLHQRLEDESQEVSEILGAWDIPAMDQQQLGELIAECADVANFAMMIADIARQRVKR